jgi:hypothetical protein
MAPDYAAGCVRMKDGTLAAYKLRKLGPGFSPHLRCLLFDVSLPHRAILFETRKEAREYARRVNEYGYPVRVELVLRVAP